MGIKFEIEGKIQLREKRDAEYFVFAKCLEMGKNFELTDGSRLGNIEISKYLSQPRSIDENGNPRLDIFAFKIRYKKDYDELKEEQIVELINTK